MSIITIAGRIGSGKTSVASQLSERLGYELITIGHIFRKMAIESGNTVITLNKQAETDDSIDEKVDGMLMSLSGHSNLVVDSRLGWHFIDSSFKVYLYTELGQAVERIYKDDRPSEDYINKTKSEFLKDIEYRMQLERERYLEKYGVDIHNTDNYNLIIDTTDRTVEDVVDIILTYYKDYMRLTPKLNVI